MQRKTKQDPLELSPLEIIKQIRPYLEPVIQFLSAASDDIFQNRFRVPFGSGGPPQYFYRLSDLVNQQFSDFLPEGLEEWRIEQSEEEIALADHRVKVLASKIQSHIFSKFRDAYGESNTLYWEKGVPNKDMKTKAYQRSLDDPPERRAPLEAYLDLLDLKKIVENRENWHLFQRSFDIPMPGSKGLAKNLRWMDRLNDIRRIPAHPYNRQYKSGDFEFLHWLEDELENRIHPHVLDQA